jgi:3-deoxy-D-manno-octulosonate 8-phosphate phosphatase (KDO 8-P phosphatase)
LKGGIEKVKLVIFDVDGVLTDGRIIISDSGEQVREFDAHDGAGMKYLLRAGLKVAILSGRRSRLVELRCKELGITDIEQGALNKIEGYERITKRFRVKDEEVCFVGDDLPDLPVMWRVGYPVAVATARPEVRAAARYVTRAEGGRGAAREVVEKILKSQGRWQLILSRYEATRSPGKRRRR